ncbi:MAG: hypothetical protein IPN83_26960 [Holophagales bacterium]|nr:hypothetical protein [Holophagales bacterium]
MTSPPFVICGPTSQFFPMFRVPAVVAVLYATMEARIVTFEAGAATVIPPPVLPAIAGGDGEVESVTFGPDG